MSLDSDFFQNALDFSAARAPKRVDETPKREANPYIGLGNLVNANNVNTLVDAIITQLLNREEVQKLINPLRIDKEILIDDKGNHVSNVSDTNSYSTKNACCAAACGEVIDG